MTSPDALNEICLFKYYSERCTLWLPAEDNGVIFVCIISYITDIKRVLVKDSGKKIIHLQMSQLTLQARFSFQKVNGYLQKLLKIKKTSIKAFCSGICPFSNCAQSHDTTSHIKISL